MPAKRKTSLPINVGEVIDRLREFERFFGSRSAMEQGAGLKHGTVAGWFSPARTALPKAEDLVRLAQTSLPGDARLSLHWLLLGEGAPLRQSHRDLVWDEVREKLVDAVAVVTKTPRHQVGRTLPSSIELRAQMTTNAVAWYMEESRPRPRRPPPSGASIGRALEDYLTQLTAADADSRP